MICVIESAMLSLMLYDYFLLLFRIRVGRGIFDGSVSRGAFEIGDINTNIANAR